MRLLPAALRRRWQPADPSRLGSRDGRLAPCPRRPNCVASGAEDPEQRVEPLPLPLSAVRGQALCREIVSGWRRCQLAGEEDGYLHFVCRTPLVGFPDDLELLFDEVAQVVQVRSASRYGYQDFGTNRRRVERLRRAWARALEAEATVP